MYTLFTLSRCPYCIGAIDLLEKKNQEYQYIQLDMLPNILTLLKKNIKHDTVP